MPQGSQKTTSLVFCPQTCRQEKNKHQHVQKKKWCDNKMELNPESGEEVGPALASSREGQLPEAQVGLRAWRRDAFWKVR